MTLSLIFAIFGWLSVCAILVTMYHVIEVAKFWRENAIRWRALAEAWEELYDGKIPERYKDQPQEKKVH